jgi:hypothetical protein
VSLDLGSPAIEIAIALAFVFFLLSLIVSALTEWLAAALKLRAKTLREGLEGMLGDKDVASEVLKHPLVRTDLREDCKHTPSYIAPHEFATAFRDLVTPVSAAAEERRPTARLSDGEGGTKTVQISAKLATQLRTLSASPTAVPPVESMDRVSGWYKRKSQKITVVLALLVTLALNASALRIAEHLAEEPTVRAAVVARAEAARTAAVEGERSTEKGEAAEEEPAEGETKGTSELKQAGKDMEEALDDLSDLKLPIFWAEEYVPDWNFDSIARAVAGWVITWFAISLGAPFWFDALNKFANLRMAGRKPETKSVG